MALDGDGTVIAQARHLAAGSLTRVQAEHGLPVSQRAMDLTQLVFSDLVTNARKYAPGPVLLDLRIVGDLVEIVVWDCEPVLPVARAADVGRVGQHGLEIVMAVAQGFEVQREPVGKRITARLRPGRRPRRHPLRPPAPVEEKGRPWRRWLYTARAMALGCLPRRGPVHRRLVVIRPRHFGSFRFGECLAARCLCWL